MSHNEYIFLKGYAQGARLYETLRALFCVRSENGSKVRKGSGEPFYYHGVRVACHLHSLGVNDDITLAAAVTHDVIEDDETGHLGSAAALQERYGISSEVGSLAEKLDKTRYESTGEYYIALAEDPRLILIKGSDRVHNSSTMVGAFTAEKVLDYIQETREYVLPMLKQGKNRFPEHSEQFYALKYHIQSVLGAVEDCFVSLDQAARVD